MTDTVQLAIIATIPPTIAAVAALVVSMLNSKKAAETGKKADSLIEKTVEIHSLTNSQLGKVTAALEVANEKIQGMEKLMSQMAETNKVNVATIKKSEDKVAADSSVPIKQS